ncbi:MAG: hypothetical protein IPH04_00655 [Saprospirales bacterium]|nr:hypothetical protein [Saprospirales bacterium]
MRIILLTPYYFPYNNPRAHRWTEIAREWARQGWEVHVVCGRNPEGQSYGTQLERVWVHPAGFNSLKELFHHWFPGIQRRVAPRGGLPKGSKGRFLRMLNDWLFKSWYWPDDAWLWIGPARRKAARLLKKGQWDAMISVSLPFSAHWAAKKLKKQFPQLPWLADIGDPFSLQSEHPLNNPLFYRNKNARAEKSVLNSADWVTVTNEGLRQAYLQTWPDLNTRIHVVGPLASPQVAKTGFDLEEVQKFHIAYFGSFFKNIREPEPLLEFFAMLSRKKDWVLHFYGDIFENFYPIFEKYPSLKPYIRFHGLVSREDATAAMGQMNLLVLLGNTTDFQLPSKWADYLMSGKPILHLLQTPSDPALPLVKDLDQVLSLPWYEVEKREEYMASFERWEAPSGDGKPWEARFSPAAIATAYADLLLSQKE